MAPDLEARLRIRPGKKVRLADHDPDATPGLHSKERAAPVLAKNVERLAELQYRLYAESKRSLLIVLQSIDAGGKDGTIRHVMDGFNPQGCSVVSFKRPTPEELGHDYLWRVHKACPRRGDIAIFNRSHYEDVLVARVEKLAPADEIERRYDQINDFERMLTDNGTILLKFYLNVGKAEQKRRFEERLQDPTKNWKFSPDDLTTRAHWSEYRHAFELALERCSTRHAPWYVIPADHKWYRNFAVSHIIVDRLEALNMKFPKPAFDPKSIHIK
jgi:PPK2 family polyphosphate:nucleotide phosphotransferase